MRRAASVGALMLLGPLLACGWLQTDRPAVPQAPTEVVAVAQPTATPWPTATPRPLPTATPSPTPTATPLPTWTPLPLPPIEATPERVAGAERLFRSRVLDVYVDQDLDPELQAWLLEQPERFDTIAATVERRLRTPLEQRILLYVQPPEEGSTIRTNCPARGAATQLEDETLFIWLFADQETPLAQREAVVAHEIAHQVIRTKLGNGGDTILNEGLANWAIPREWAEWQGHPSFDSFVLETRARGTYIPLAQSEQRNLATPTPDENCFQTRDQVYNQWASFADYLIRTYGWGAIRTFWRQRPESSYDYEVGFGKSLAELEREWLAQLGRGRT